MCNAGRQAVAMHTPLRRSSGSTQRRTFSKVNLMTLNGPSACCPPKTVPGAPRPPHLHRDCSSGGCGTEENALAGNRAGHGGRGGDISRDRDFQEERTQSHIWNPIHLDRIRQNRMYRYVPVCTGTYRYMQVQDFLSSTYWYVLVCTKNMT